MTLINRTPLIIINITHPSRHRKRGIPLDFTRIYQHLARFVCLLPFANVNAHANASHGRGIYRTFNRKKREPGRKKESKEERSV